MTQGTRPDLVRTVAAGQSRLPQGFKIGPNVDIRRGEWADVGEYEAWPQPDVGDLSRQVAGLTTKVAHIEHQLERIYKLLLAVSQAYYWSPAWQEKERRAESELREGKGERFESVEDLISSLHSR